MGFDGVETELFTENADHVWFTGTALILQSATEGAVGNSAVLRELPERYVFLGSGSLNELAKLTEYDNTLSHIGLPVFSSMSQMIKITTHMQITIFRSVYPSPKPRRSYQGRFHSFLVMLFFP